MKKIILFTAIVCLLISPQTFAQDETGEQIVVPLSRPTEPGQLIVDHIKGSIFVTGYEGEFVIVDASFRQNQNPSNNEGLKKIASTMIQLTAQEMDNEVVVATNSHKHTIDLHVRLPMRFSLKLKTYHNGEIHVQNVSGEMEITNINGDVQLEEVSGSAVINTIDGDILAEFTEVTPDIPMAFTSVEGKIDVTFPADIQATVKMKSDNGEIFSDFDVDMEKRKTQIDKSNKTGINRVTLEEWTHGNINGGGPIILLKSLEGSIFIRKRK